MSMQRVRQQLRELDKRATTLESKHKLEVLFIPMSEYWEPLEPIPEQDAETRVIYRVPDWFLGSGVTPTQGHHANSAPIEPVPAPITAPHPGPPLDPREREALRNAEENRRLLERMREYQALEDLI